MRLILRRERVKDATISKRAGFVYADDVAVKFEGGFFLAWLL